MQIEVKNLLPNPFRNIETYPIDREKIRQLRNSIRETTFWDNILARPAPKDRKFEIAYGHHRLVALKEELGKDATVDIPVRDLSDEDMLRIMANENMEQWGADWRVIVETIKQAKKFLENNVTIAKKYGGYKREHSALGERVISAFLGKNWPKTKIHRALIIMKDKEIEVVLKDQDSKKLGISSLEFISSIQNEEIKKKWLEEKLQKDISSTEIQEIARFENEPILSDHDKEIVRENILEGRIRGKEQIREHVDLLKVRKLQEAKKSDEDKRKEELKDFLEKTNGAAVSLNNKLEVLVAQFKEYPETQKYLPREETMKLSRSLTMLFITVKEIIDMTKRIKEKERKELTD